MELIKIENETALLDPEISAKIAAFEQSVKRIKAQEDELRAAILAEMESKNILSLETDELTITYKAPYDRETLDSKTLRKSWPDIYDEHVRMSRVKSSIAIKVKQ